MLWYTTSKLKNKIQYLLFFVIFLFLFSCKKKVCVSTVPELTFTSFTVSPQYTGLLALEFYDCDGDVGLNTTDTSGVFKVGGDFYYNLKLTYLEKQNGIWKRFDSLTPPFHYRIPVLNKDGSNTTLEGQISVTLEPLYYVPIGVFDTIKFEIVLIDRALNLSNPVETNEIIKP